MSYIVEYAIKGMAKVRLGSYIVENAKIMSAKVWLGTYMIEKAKIRYNCEVSHWKF